MNKITLMIVFLIAFMTLACVSAADDNATSDGMSADDTLQIGSSTDSGDATLNKETGEGTFAQLSDLIENTPEGGTITLEKNYTADASTSKYGITISKQITIDGNGHILDAKGISRIFKIKSSEVVLKNIIFKNGNSTKGGAVSYNCDYDVCCNNCIIDHCTFMNCQATQSGAIYFDRGYMFSDGGHGYQNGCRNINITGCNFMNCSSKTDGGAMCFYDESENGIIENCNFIECKAKGNGGAVYFYSYSESHSGIYNYYYYNSKGTISNCSFLGCSAEYGGAIHIGRDYLMAESVYGDYFIGYYPPNSTVRDCNFRNCSAIDGGAVYWGSTYGKIENSNFTASHAKNGGAVYADESVDLAIANSNFSSNSADEFGGAVYGGTICNCSFSENTNPEIYNPYAPKLTVREKNQITDCRMVLHLPRDATGNISIYVFNETEGNYKFSECVNITDSIAEIYYNSPKIGDIKIKTVADTNYGVYESFAETTITSIEFDDFEYMHYLNSSYQVSVRLPKDAVGNFSLYSSDKLYECVNLTNGSATIDFKTLKEGKYHFTAVCLSNYGFENATNDVEFEDGSDMYMWDATVFCNDAKKYTVEVVDINGEIAGKGVQITVKIGSTTIKAKTNANGKATVNIPKLKPGKYTITAKYRNAKASTKLTVKHIVTLKTVKVKRSAKKIVLQATLKNKKPIKGKTVTFKFAGKTYKAKTNSKGIAKVNIYSKVLKKLKAGKKVTYQATYLKDTVKKTAKIQK